MNKQIQLINLPNLLTTSNLLCGTLCVIYAMQGRIDVAPFLLLFAAFFDLLDGMVARMLKVGSELGKQLDSLADMVSFGVAPGVTVMVVLAAAVVGDVQDLNQVQTAWTSWADEMLQGSGSQNWINWLPFVSLVIPACSMLRLAKFNIDERQSTSFIGLPTPGNALFFMTFPLVICFGDTSSGLTNLAFHPAVMTTCILIMSALLISELPLFSLKLKNLSWKENQAQFLLVLGAIIFIPLFKVWSIALIVFLYLILSVLFYQKSKKVKA